MATVSVDVFGEGFVAEMAPELEMENGREMRKKRGKRENWKISSHNMEWNAYWLSRIPMKFNAGRKLSSLFKKRIYDKKKKEN